MIWESSSPTTTSIADRNLLRMRIEARPVRRQWRHNCWLVALNLAPVMPFLEDGVHLGIRVNQCLLGGELARCCACKHSRNRSSVQNLDDSSISVAGIAKIGCPTFGISQHSILAWYAAAGIGSQHRPQVGNGGHDCRHVLKPTCVKGIE